MKRSFFQAAVVSILLYECTTWTLTKRLKKWLDGNYTECCEEYWTSPGGNTPEGTIYTANCLPSRKLSKLDELDTQDTAGEARTNSSVMYSNGLPHMAKQKQDDQLEHTYSSYVRIRDVAQKTCQKRWMIGRSGDRRVRDIRSSGMTWWWRYIYIYIYIYIYTYMCVCVHGEREREREGNNSYT